MKLTYSTLVVAILLLFTLPSLASPFDNSPMNDKAGSFYINNPLSLVGRIRLKNELHLKNNQSLLIGITYFYNTESGDMKGPQAFLELRKYIENQRFIYGKIGGGIVNVHVYDGSTGATLSTTNYGYALIGAGLGKQYYLNKKETFIFEYAAGLQVVFDPSGKIVDWELPTFVLFGPGAFLNINLNFGYRIYRR
ncbi:MAG: hypothetical protein ACK417_12225 [Bacteroidia bacterium]